MLIVTQDKKTVVNSNRIVAYRNERDSGHGMSKVRIFLLAYGDGERFPLGEFPSTEKAQLVLQDIVSAIAGGKNIYYV